MRWWTVVTEDGYESMVEGQKPGQRLSKGTFQAIEVLAYALANLDGYLPSVASLQGEVYHQIVALVRMLADFNFAQMLQGENNPHSVWQLQCAREDEGEDVYRTFLFVQVSILCGVTGSMSLAGSMFLTEPNGRSVMKGLACLHDLTGVDPAAVYWNYISSRAEALDLHVATPRTVQASSLQALANSWEDLTNQEQDSLLELFLADGHEDKAFILLYLPLYIMDVRKAYHRRVASTMARGQLVDEDRKLQMLELVAAQQRRLEDALMGRRQSVLVQAQRLHKDPLGFAASVASMTSSQPECKEKTFRFASCVDQDCS
ncbi:hypothetical protein AK812_SmicGene41871 [Symbiodinium microadriaticum]|uniref:Uncharacterized protein n=1 Tax=Symbiodinium microadriaticum TaxID=2951 RepID=A0A1Q9C505_SYMMI|nr:hypothetical protein AK812_SmicGene41871 [Symbiodinium microadriaticum]